MGATRGTALPCGKMSPNTCSVSSVHSQKRQTLCSASVPDAYRDCQRLPWFHTRPKDGSQPAPVSEVWSKLAPTRSAGSFFSFCFSSKIIFHSAEVFQLNCF